jgi:hydrogenase maturation protease
MTSIDMSAEVLVLGIGNLLMSDEGVGVHTVQRIENTALPPGVQALDGGTGGFHLLDAMHRARTVILIDATMDGQPPGTITRLTPRFSRDYPKTLTAHDIGLKDLLDTYYLLDRNCDVVLYAVSIAPDQEIGTELSPEISGVLDRLSRLVVDEAALLHEMHHAIVGTHAS